MKTKLYLLAFLSLGFNCGEIPNKSKKETIEADSKQKQHTQRFLKEHSSKNTLDYLGIYKGTIPCADCSGIKTTIELFKDGTFLKTLAYLGKDDEPSTQEGKYTWNDRGSKITLEAGTENTQIYQVGENVLFHLDRDGNRIKGDLEEHYQLPKINSHDDIENKK